MADGASDGDDRPGLRERVASAFDRMGEYHHRDLVIFVVGTVFGLAFFTVAMGGRPGAAGDTPVYVELARGVFAGRGFMLDGEPSATYPPGYPVFIAPFVALTGGAGAGVVVLQCALGGWCAVLVARIGDLIYSPAVGLVAGALTAVAPQLAFWAAYPISDVLGLALMLAGVVLLFRSLPIGPLEDGVRAFSTGRALGAGALFGLAALVRPLSLSLTLPALVWLISSRLAAGRRQRLGVAALTISALVAVVAPWAIRNAVEFNGFFPLSTRNGWQLIQATEWNTTGRGTVGVDVRYPDEASGLPEGEADRLLTQIALRRIRSDPAGFARRAALKVGYMWLPTAPGLGLGSLAMGLEFCAVAVAAAVAMFLREGRRGWVLWLMTAGAALGIAMTILDPDFRYRLPVLLVLMPAASWLAVRILRGESPDAPAST